MSVVACGRVRACNFIAKYCFSRKLRQREREKRELSKFFPSLNFPKGMEEDCASSTKVSQFLLVGQRGSRPAWRLCRAGARRRARERPVLGAGPGRERPSSYDRFHLFLASGVARLRDDVIEFSELNDVFFSYLHNIFSLDFFFLFWGCLLFIFVLFLFFL